VFRTISPSTQHRFHANHFQQQENVKGQKMNDTYGPLFSHSSPSCALQSLLVSRCQRLLEWAGSTGCSPILKEKATPAGRSYWEHSVQVPRTGGSGYTGLASWPTADATNAGDGLPFDQQMEAMLTGPSPSRGPAATERQGECRGELQTPKGTGGGNVSRGNERKGELLLAGQAQAAGWQTPKQSDCKSPGKSRDVHLGAQAQMAGWATPQASDNVEGSRTAETSRQKCLGRDMNLIANYPTPNQTDSKGLDTSRYGQEGMTGNRMHRLSDFAATQMPTPDMTGWRLNARFSLWLQGFPRKWADSGLRAYAKAQSIKRTRKAR
jgi:hypothetical protein